MNKFETVICLETQIPQPEELFEIPLEKIGGGATLVEYVMLVTA
jgi:hypothetical protein